MWLYFVSSTLNAGMNFIITMAMRYPDISEAFMNHGALLGRKHTTTTTTATTTSVLVFKMQNVIDWLTTTFHSVPLFKITFVSFSTTLSRETLAERERGASVLLPTTSNCHSLGPLQLVQMWGLFVISPEDKPCSQKNRGTLNLLLSWEGDQLISIKDVTLMVYIRKSHQRGDIKCTYIFTTKLHDFKTNSEQCRASGKTDVENLGYLLASDVDSAGESFLWVVL